MPHGRAWKIHDKDLLIDEVAPRYFVQTKYQSFTRQLNGWGFKRLHQSGNDFNAFYHECFLRGMPKLVALMKRVSPNQGRLLPDVEGEPNFYQIDKYFKLPVPHDNCVIGSFEHEMKTFNEKVGFKEETSLDTKIEKEDATMLTTKTATIINKKRAVKKNDKMSKKKKGGLLMRKMLQISSPTTIEHPSIQNIGPPSPPTHDNNLTVDPLKPINPAPRRYYPTLCGPPPPSQYPCFTNPIVSPLNFAEVEAYSTAASSKDLQSPPNFPDVNTYPFTQSVGLASKRGFKEGNYPVITKDDQVQHCPIVHQGFPGTMSYDSFHGQDDLYPPPPLFDDSWHSGNSTMTKSGNPMPYGPLASDKHTRFKLQPLELYAPTLGTSQKVVDSMDMNEDEANRSLHLAYHSALTQDDDADEYHDDPLAFDQDEWIGFD